MALTYETSQYPKIKNLGTSPVSHRARLIKTEPRQFKNLGNSDESMLPD